MAAYLLPGVEIRPASRVIMGEKDPDDSGQQQSNYTGLGLALGLGIGTAIGAATDNMSLWLALGVAFGLALSAAYSAQKK